MVKLDNSTRWNSTYYSLQRALKIRTRIQQFCIPYALDLRLDLLDDDDWEHLEAVAECLKPFQEATLRLEGNAQRGSHGAIWEALPILEALAAELRQGLKRYLDDKDSQFLLQPSGKRQKTQTSRMHRQQQTTSTLLQLLIRMPGRSCKGIMKKPMKFMRSMLPLSFFIQAFVNSTLTKDGRHQSFFCGSLSC
jgi:hypothetical protein